ncbi:amidohydrolase family protein [Phenylobacterium sp.]|jgi:predicted TIM-barrel fold metal-dependent hydrolase|uniref:amidohydrolase family protein n=1 Tax=Phenylobacterium sp. TaxID=1871053 RepID=UPI002F3EE06F
MIERHIISADGHNVEPPHIWDRYLDRRFAAKAPRLVKDPEGGDAWEFSPGGTPMPIGLVTNAGRWGRRYEENNWFGSTYDSIRQGAFDGRARLDEQDIDGVSAEVIYPSQRTMGAFMAQEDDAFHVAGVEAYNRWLAEEFCAADPARLIGLEQMPATDIRVSVAHLNDARRAGRRGVIISGWPSGGEALSAADDAFWAAAQDLNMPVHIHVGLAQAGRRKPPPPTAQDPGGKIPLQKISGAVAGASDFVSKMILSEMFDRFPALTVVLAETGAGWIPHFLEFLDDHWWRNRVWSGSQLKAPPSEYFRRNFYVTFIREPFAVLNRHSIGVDNMMWSNDYPHHRHDWPYSRRVIEDSFIGVPNSEKRQMIHGNASRLYNISLPDS